MRSRLATFAVALPLVAAGAHAQVPVDGQFQVNTTAASYQVNPALAASSSGDFVVVWTSDGSGGSDASRTSIQGQRFAPNGAPLGGEFQVNSYTQSYQLRPAVATTPAGEFVVAWSSFGSNGTDTSFYSIQGQRFADDGMPVDAQFQVNSSTRGMQDFAAATAVPGSGFVVLWHSDASLGGDSSGRSVQAQRFAADGERLGGETQVNVTATGEQLDPAVASWPGGELMAVWVDSSDPTTGRDIRGRRYGADGAPAGGEFVVNTLTAGNQYNPALAVGTGGDFVVVWSSNGSPGSDSSGYSILGRQFSPDGTSLGEDFQVNAFTTSNQTMPAVTAEATGGFVVAWRSGSPSDPGPDGAGEGISARRLRPDGTFRSDEVVVNDFVTGDQMSPSVTVLPSGDFVVTWASNESGGSDQDEESIQARLFARDPALGPEAWFSWQPSEPEVGEEVQLTDASAGGPSAWSWDLGDGASAAEASVAHAYGTAGTYSVSLTVTGDSGVDTVTRRLVVREQTVPGEDPDLVIPAVARVAGSSAFFTSRVDLFNAGTETIQLEVVYTPREDVGGEARTTVLALPPAVLSEVEDPLAVWFGDEVGESAVGSLMLRTLTGGAAEVMVQSVVFARNGDGSEYGQFFPAVRADEVLEAGQTAFLSTTPDPSRYRVNVGLMALADDTEMTVTPVDPIGNPLASGETLALGKGGSVQLNDVHHRFSLAGRADFLLEVDVARGRAVAYGSILDGTGGVPGTNDPTTVLPVRGGAPQVVLLELGSIQGIDEFAGSASVTNHSTLDTTVQATLYRRDEPGPAATATLAIPAGDTVGYRDMVSELFGLADTVGTVVLGGTTGGSVSATGREYAVFRDPGGEVTGTAGQQMPGLTSSDLLPANAVAHLLGLRQLDSALGTERSHLAVFNPGSSAATLTVALFDAASGAAEGVVTRTVEARELVRVNSVLSIVDPGQDGEAKRLEVTTTAPVYLLAYRVNRWGDPWTIPPFLQATTTR